MAPHHEPCHPTFFCFPHSKVFIVGFVLGILTAQIISLGFILQNPNTTKVIENENLLGENTHQMASRQSTESKTNATQSTIRILCLILTSPKSHFRAHLV
jgi:hypothetical protein